MTDVSHDSDITVISSSAEKATEKKPAISPEVIEKLKRFDQALAAVENSIQPHLQVSYEQHTERNPLDMARIDVMSMFTMTSLAWVLTSLKGERPKNHLPMTSELKRSKDYMDRFNTAEKRKEAPRINKFAAKAFVRNALWEVPENSKTCDSTIELSDNEDVGPQ